MNRPDAFTTSASGTLLTYHEILELCLFEVLSLRLSGTQ
jgi:hypothetical protein